MRIETAVLLIPEARPEAGFEPRWYAGPVAGLPLLARILFLLKSQRIRRVLILGPERDIPGLTALLSRWRKDRRLPEVEIGGTGGAAPRALPVHFLMVDGSHVFHPKLVELALSQPSRAALFTEDGGSSAIGVLSAGDPLSLAALQELPRISAPKGIFSRPARNRAERREAEGWIFRSLRRETDGWVAARLNRPVSLFLSRRLVRTPIHPNGFTLATFLVGLGSGFLAARGTSLSMAVGGVLFQLASVLDGVDGEAARAKFLTSRVGGWLDTICDETTNLAFLVGVIVGVRRLGYPGIFVWLGAAALTLYALTILLLYGHLVFKLRRSSLLAFEEEIKRPEFRQSKGAGLVLLLQPLIKRDLYAFLFMVLCLAGWPWLVVVLWLLAVALTPALYAGAVRRFIRARSL